MILILPPRTTKFLNFRKYFVDYVSRQRKPVSTKRFFNNNFEEGVTVVEFDNITFTEQGFQRKLIGGVNSARLECVDDSDILTLASEVEEPQQRQPSS